MDDCAAVNPHFDERLIYQQNCSHTVAAYEMRRRGYNVTATGAAGNDKYKAAGMRAWGYADHDAAIDAGAVIFCQSKRSARLADEIGQAIADAGNGARFEIRVGWKRGGGHFFVGENVDGVPVFIDPQSGEYGEPVREYFSNAKPSGTWYTRIDDRDLDPAIMADLCEVNE
jgi:hypothetical protein